MTPWTRLERRARSAAAVLLAALAVVGSVLVGPSAASQVAGSGTVLGAAARGAAPAGVALRPRPPAIGNAIANALGGIRIRDLPVKPDKIVALLNAAATERS